MPYLVMWIGAIATTQVADHVVGKKIFRTVSVRKFCQAVGHIGSACALIGASYTGCDRTLTVTLLTVAVGMNGAIYGGISCKTIRPIRINSSKNISNQCDLLYRIYGKSC